jgi:urocanate hydratase
MVLDGTEDAERRLRSMLHWDVNNGIARRAWARNSGAIHTAQIAMEKEPTLSITMPNLVEEEILNGLFH